jgi:hypothetical protein
VLLELTRVGVALRAHKGVGFALGAHNGSAVRGKCGAKKVRCAEGAMRRKKWCAEGAVRGKCGAREVRCAESAVRGRCGA